MDVIYICIAHKYICEEIYKLIKHKMNNFKVLVGLSYNHEFDYRKDIYERVCGGGTVLCEKTESDRISFIRKIKPSEVIYFEGDIYINSPFKVNEYKELVRKWNGECNKLVSKDILSSLIDQMNIDKQRNMKLSLKTLFQEKKMLRIIESHSGLSCMLMQNLGIVGEDGSKKQFDGFWVSSLCDSLLRGKPDMEIIDLHDRINTIDWMLSITNKPIIVDLDSGGRNEKFVCSVLNLSRIGVSAVVIEDKVGRKINSLFTGNIKQEQDSIDDFCEKIRVGKKAISNQEMMIIARIESLTLGKDVEDALIRAEKYIEAGADGILIHNNKQDIEQIEEFCLHYNNFKNRIPLIVIPSSYSFVYEKDLQKIGCNMVIYANQLTRSIIPTMLNTAKKILENERALEASEECISIKEVLDLVDCIN